MRKTHFDVTETFSAFNWATLECKKQCEIKLLSQSCWLGNSSLCFWNHHVRWWQMIDSCTSIWYFPWFQLLDCMDVWNLVSLGCIFSCADHLFTLTAFCLLLRSHWLCENRSVALTSMTNKPVQPTPLFSRTQWGPKINIGKTANK